MMNIWPPFRRDDGVMVTPPDHEVWANSHPNVKQFSEKICSKMIHPNCLFVDVVGVGPIPVNEAIKAIAISREKLAEYGIDVFVVPFFSEVQGEDGRELTRLVLRAFKEEMFSGKAL